LAVELSFVTAVEGRGGTVVEGVVDGVGDVGGGVGFGEFGLEVALVGGDVDFDGLGFEGPEALLAPFAEDGVGEEVDFVGVIRLVFEDIGEQEALEGGVVFDAEEGVGADGGKAVFEGVAGGLGFAAGGAGASGMEGVAPVGVDLSLGGHGLGVLFGKNPE